MWPQVRTGSAPAVAALVRVSERRARLLGLDAPIASRTEVTGSLSVQARTQLKAERELFSTLTLEQMAEIAADSQALIDKMAGMAQANRAIGCSAPSPDRLLEGETIDVSPGAEPT